MALASCGTNTPIEAEVAAEATREVARPDSFFLVPCGPIPKAQGDTLEEALELITTLLDQYSLMCERHNLLLEQL